MTKRRYGQESEGLLERFHWHLRDRRRSAATQRVYLGALRRFAAAVCLAWPVRADVNAWLRERRLGLSQGSLNGELAAVRAFYAYACRAGLVQADARPWLPAGHRPAERLPRALEEHQVGALLAAPDVGTALGLRDHLLLRLAYETGLRASELAALHVGDVTADGWVHVARGLGDRPRWVPVSAALVALVGRWVAVRRSLKPGKRGALFVTARGQAFAGGRTVWGIVSRHARAALGLGRGLERLAASRRRPWGGQYTHLLRSSCADALLSRGVDLRAVQELLGHADVRTTARYERPDLARLEAEHSKAFGAKRGHSSLS